MESYNPQKIEKKWQQFWEEKGTYKNYTRAKKFYALDMFPYPSGEGLHVGHPKGYIATDVVSRYKLLNGYSVLHPMGWDAFGLPAENFAIKNKVHPRVAVEKNIATFKKQLGKFGFTYDWDREINTTDPEYYKWTQWIFLKLFEKGLAYESNEPVNWCPSCKTVLANEDLENGLCERCGSEVEQKPLRQWVLKMTSYADRLLYDLDKEELDWEDSIVQQQKNWIGRSEGVVVKFQITNDKFQTNSKIQISNEQNFIEVFTTRIDTIFGCTYCVVAPEHPIISNLKSQISNFKEVEAYIVAAQKKTTLQRTDLAKEKTGVRLEGLEAINPFTGEAVPLFVADYVLGGYGTGAVMAVPAHDERDFAFAKKYDLPIRQSIVNDFSDYEKTTKALEIYEKITKAGEKENVNFWIWGGLACAVHAGVVYRTHSDLDLITKKDVDFEKVKDILGKVGFKIVAEKKLTENLVNLEFADKDGFVVDIGPNIGEFGLQEKDLETEKKIINGIKVLAVSKKFAESIKQMQIEKRCELKDKLDIEYLKGKVLIEDGFLVDSGEYSSLSSNEAREKMTAWLEKEKLGQRKVNYKMRDWVFSRQRYWGEPIPILHCAKCGAVGVPENELPVLLPEVEHYEPTGTGEGPLAAIAEWVNTTCPKCGGAAKRETNTMPQWAGSSWYYLRYIDPENKKELVAKELEKQWMPVDLYVGGAEHATRHLLYARFWHKFLFDIGVVSTLEPFKKLVHVGLIQAEDGRKMSKRWGNVINPDDIIRDFGADSIRLYEMFMGPFTQGIAWSTDGVKGVRKFLEKIWRIQLVDDQNFTTSKKIQALLHKTIKKVTADIEDFRFNTAISAMMILVNAIDKEGKLAKEEYGMLLKILSPFAPHMAEELWEKSGHTESIFQSNWPAFDLTLTKDEEVQMVVQINGKVRERLLVAADVTEDEIKETALENEKIKLFTQGKEIKKIIFVPGKLINIVVV